MRQYPVAEVFQSRPLIDSIQVERQSAAYLEDALVIASKSVELPPCLEESADDDVCVILQREKEFRIGPPFFGLSGAAEQKIRLMPDQANTKEPSLKVG